MCAGNCMEGYWWVVPMIFWGLMMLGFVIFLARGGFRRWRRRGWAGCCGDAGSQLVQTPHELLRIRYARGEITKDELEQLRRDLGD